MPQNTHVLLTFDKVHNPLLLPREATSEPPKVVREGCVLYILTWKCASRHNGVHFFDISTAKSGPDLVCFVHFDLEKHSVSRLSYLFAHLHLLSSYSFSSTLLSSNLSLLSAFSLPCFSSVHIVGSLTSKLPSIRLDYIILYHIILYYII